MAATTLIVDIREFLDGEMLEGVHVGVRPSVYTATKRDIVDVPDDLVDRGRFGGDGSPSGGGVMARTRSAALPTERITVALKAAGFGRGAVARRARDPITVIDSELADVKWGVTDASGSVSFTWDEANDGAYAAARSSLQRRHGPNVSLYLGFAYAVRLVPVNRRRPLASPGLFNQTFGQVPEGAAVRRTVRADLAATVVGHVTETSARLWFSLAPNLGRLTASYDVRGVGDRVGRVLPRQPVRFGGGDVPTSVVDVTGLAPGTDYEYDLELSNGTSSWRAARGWFRTSDPAATSWRFGFASCHKPLVDADTANWAALTAWGPECTFLLGDQVYGDYFADKTVELNVAGVKGEFVVSSPIAPPDAPPAGWEEWFVSRYRTSWGRPEVRDSLRRQATYMMLDDHEISDDWGTTFTTVDSGEQPRMVPGLGTYDRFQHSHNPPTPGRAFDDARDYAVARDAVCAYVLDQRTRRGVGAAPRGVLGPDQWSRLRAWAASPEVAAADVVFIVSPVPLAFCDVVRAQDLIETLNTGAGILSGVTRVLGVNAVVEAVTGWSMADDIDSLKIAVQYHNGRMVEPDMADQWAHSDNQDELRDLLDLLFALQNDPGRQRLVVVLAGDAHVGAVHTIRAATGANDSILQLMSSPIGREPHATLAGALDEASHRLGWFDLTRGYLGHIEAVVGRRNFGSVVVERQPGSGRVYEIRAALQSAAVGDDAASEERVDVVVDLDAPGRAVVSSFARRTSVRRSRPG